MANIDVAKGDALRPGVPTTGITRSTALESPVAVVSRSEIEPGAISVWHHHESRDLFGYLASGRLRFDYGPGGSLAVEIRAGDHFHIPPRLVHRDVNPSTEERAVVIAVLVGSGPTVVNVRSPSGR